MAGVSNTRFAWMRCVIGRLSVTRSSRWISIGRVRAGSQRLDPVVGFGAVNGTSLQWGVRRTMSRTGGEVFLHFRGLDYGNNLGKQQMLAMANVMASNRHIAQSVRVGVPMAPVDGAGNWRGTLVAVPTAYIPGVVGAGAMETMIGYLNSSAVGLVGDARPRWTAPLPQAVPGGGPGELDRWHR